MDGASPEATDRNSEFGSFGSNQLVMRERNERLVLTILRRKGPQAKADIARQTGLSAQTVSVIMRALERDGLIEKGDKVRGKVGQPSVPMRLSPEGALFLGLKVGRSSAELVLVNFVGDEIAHLVSTYDYPTPDRTLDFVRTALREICEGLTGGQRQRIAGLGIASPFFLWEWAAIIGVDADKMAAWRGFDLVEQIRPLVDFPVYLGNDATSACGAELTFGTADRPADFLYVYIGYLIGGGVVLNGTLFAGKTGNAGAIGPFPILARDGSTAQLVDKASLIALERRLGAKAYGAAAGQDTADDWSADQWAIIEDWLAEAIPSLAQLVVGACSIIGFQSVVVDGNMSDRFRAVVVDRLAQALDEMPLSGLIRPDIIAGTLGTRARPLGAASLPLSKRFLLET